MKTRFAILLLLLMGMSFGVMAWDDGSKTLEHCSPVLKFADGEQVSDLALVNGTFCEGYVFGYIDAMAVADYLTGRKRRICMPSGVSASQATRVFVKYLRDNPGELHLNASVLLYSALAIAYPCK